MTIEMITAKMELKELVDVFSNLADIDEQAEDMFFRLVKQLSKRKA